MMALVLMSLIQLPIAKPCVCLQALALGRKWALAEDQAHRLHRQLTRDEREKFDEDELRFIRKVMLLTGRGER